MTIVKATVENWDGKSKFKKLDPKLQNLMDIGTETHNTILGFYKEHWNLTTRVGYLDDYEQAAKLRVENEPKIEQLMNEAKAKAGIMNKFIQTMKEVVPKSLWVEGLTFPRPIKLTKNQGISNLILKVNSSKLGSVSLSSKDVDIISDLFVKYVDFIEAAFGLWEEFTQTPDLDISQIGYIFGLLPLYQLPINIRKKIIAWWGIGVARQKMDWIHAWSWWKDNISSDWYNDENSMIINDEIQGIFEVSKDQIVFESFRNLYEPGPLIRVDGTIISGFGKGSIAIQWEDNALKKFVKKIPWDMPKCGGLFKIIEQPINYMFTLSFIKKIFGATPYKNNAKIVYEFYPKGFRIRGK
ncbi:MAG: hypothetical protein ACTSPY_17375 [Candidatus Helarchaeota archaeon]